MANLIYLVMILLITICRPACANDSSVGESNGSIQFLKQNDISMAKERLLIDSDRINVDYVFINHSAQDVTIPVAFPMPAITKNGGEDHSPGIANFKLSVDGKPVHTQSRWRVMRIDEKGNSTEDITEKVLQNHWTIQQLVEAFQSDDPISYSDKEKESPLPSEWFVGDELQNIAVQQYFIWQQRFPAGKEVIIHHAYTPSLSGGVPQSLKLITGDGSEYYTGDSCLTPLTRKSLQQLQNEIKHKSESRDDIGWDSLNYILTTGANWKDGVIGDFTLRIHKQQKNEVVVPCFSYPLTQIAPLTLEFKQKNFKPTENIHLTFYYDASI